MLSPLLGIYLSMHAIGLKQWLVRCYQQLLDTISDLMSAKAVDGIGSIKPAVGDKQTLDRAAGSGSFPITVCLGLFYTPFYLYTMFKWNTHDFLLFNTPLMFLFALICCEDTHYDSHYWLTRRYQNVWYRRLISGRFKQYTQMIWYPLTQHLPHLYIHHKFNGKNNLDVDYVGCHRREGIAGFLNFISCYEVNFLWKALQYFYSLPGSRLLLRFYIKDTILNYGLLAFAAYCGWEKFLFQYICHCVCYFFVAWVAFYVEHPFHHQIDGSYEHNWNTLTLVNSSNGLCSESHASHHNWPTRTIDENAAWVNDPVKFASSQIESRHLAIMRSGTFQELLHLPYLLITSNYSEIARALHFKTVEQLEKAGMESHLIDAYQVFRSQCDEAEIKRRLQPH